MNLKKNIYWLMFLIHLKLTQNCKLTVCVCVCVCVCVLVAWSCPIFLTPWTLSTEFYRQEYWSGLPFLSPGDLSNPGIQPRDGTHISWVSCIWSTREAPILQPKKKKKINDIYQWENWDSCHKQMSENRSAWPPTKQYGCY